MDATSRSRSHLARLARYGAVSIFTNALTATGFAVLVGVLGLSADWVNVVLITLLIPVVFALNRRFVWRTHGTRWRPYEVAPFAFFSLAGVVLTTVAVHLATHAVPHWSSSGRAGAAEAANLAASGALWASQYLMVSKFLWLADTPSPPFTGAVPEAAHVAPTPTTAHEPTPRATGARTRAQAILERRSPVIIAVVALGAYLVAAWWMRDVIHYAIGDALSRSADARAMVDSRDPHLAAMGFVWLPFPVLSQAPLSLILSRIGRADLAGPFSTAVCSAVMIYTFGLICRAMRLSLPTSLLLTALLAFNPVVVYYAGNGMSEASSFMFYTVAALGLVRWSRSLKGHDLAIIGLGLAGAMLCRYETLLLIPIFAIAAALCLPAGRRAVRWVMIAITVALPSVVVFALWLAASQIIMHDAFFWQKTLRFEGTPPKTAAWLPPRTLTNGIRYSARLVALLAPGFVPLSLALVFRRHARTAMIGAAFVAAGCAFPLYVAYGVGTNQSWGDPRYFAPLAIFGAIGGLWLVGTQREERRRAWCGGVAACTLVSILASVHFLSSPRIAPIEGEPAVFGRLSGTAPVDSGYNQALVAWHQVDSEIDPLLTGHKTVAVDTNVEFVAPLLTDKPDRFIVDSDRDFQSIMSDPVGKVSYILDETGATSNDESLFANDLAQTTGGRWRPVGRKFQVGNGATVQLYEWVAAPAAA